MNNADDIDDTDGVTLSKVARMIRPKWKPIAGTSVAASLIACGVCFLIPPTYTAKTSLISPQQQQNSAANSIFVPRINGRVISARQSNSGWLSFSTVFSALPALRGDTVFVPEELNNSSYKQEAKEWAQILCQFGIGIAALNPPLISRAIQL